MDAGRQESDFSYSIRHEASARGDTGLGARIQRAKSACEQTQLQLQEGLAYHYDELAQKPIMWPQKRIMSRLRAMSEYHDKE